MTPEEQQPTEEDLKALRKKASQTGLLLGALSLVVGALICLFYLLYYKPYQFK